MVMGKSCLNCENPVTEKFCGICGHNQELKRIDKSYAFQELLNLIGIEKGFLFSCKELLIKPGITIQEYINKNRQRVTKPITFLILSSVIYTLIYHYFKTENPYSELSKKMYGDSSINNIMNWIQENYGYANLIMILPITLWSMLLFSKYKYNFYETFVLICFVMGMGMLIFSLEPILNWFSIKTFFINESIVLIIAFLYMGWAIGQSYEKKIINYIKGIFTYSLGFITFQIVTFGIGLAYDIIKNK
jgi:hypothetical protein